MNVSEFLPAVSRRMLAIGAVVVLSAATGAGLKAQTTPPAQQPAAPAQQDPFLFATQGDNLIVLITIKGAAANEWEQLMKLDQQALGKTTDATRKQQAAHWKVFKGGPIPNDPDKSIMFFWYLDQVVKDKSYNPFTIAYEAGLPQDQVKPLYDKIAAPGMISGLLAAPYSPVVDMSSASGGGSQ